MADDAKRPLPVVDAGLDHLIAGISLEGSRDLAASIDALEQVATEILPQAAEF